MDKLFSPNGADRWINDGQAQGLVWGSMFGLVFYFAMAQSVEEQGGNHEGIYVTSIIVSCILGAFMLYFVYLGFRSGAFTEIVKHIRDSAGKDVGKGVVTLCVLALLCIYTSVAASVYSDAEKTPNSSSSFDFGIAVALACASGLSFLVIAGMWAWPHVKGSIQS